MLHRLSLCTFRYFSSVKAYNPAKNYYKVLNLSESASQKDIKRSFRELAKKYHPDSTKGKEEAFKEVNEAYQVLSDESIKRNYDEERRISDTSSHAHNSHNHNHHSHNGYHGQAYNHNHNQSHSHGHNAQYNQAHSNYRGYQREEGWQNRNFREQFMYDLHRAQQADYQRNFDPSERARYEREFRQNMQRATRGASETIRQYTEAAKQKQAQARKQYEADEKARQEQEKEYFRQYRDYQTHHDINEKMKQKLNKIADDIAGNIKQVLSVTDELKNIWNNIKKKK